MLYSLSYYLHFLLMLGYTTYCVFVPFSGSVPRPVLAVTLVLNTAVLWFGFMRNMNDHEIEPCDLELFFARIMVVAVTVIGIVGGMKNMLIAMFFMSILTMLSAESLYLQKWLSRGSQIAAILCFFLLMVGGM